MGISNKVKGMLQLKGKKNTELATYLGMTPQSLANKFNRDSFSAADLVKIADFLDCELAFILPDNQYIKLTLEDLRSTDKG